MCPARPDRGPGIGQGSGGWQGPVPGASLAEDVRPSLSGLVDAFEEAPRSREDGRDGLAADRAGIRAALSSGVAAVRKLDLIVGNQLQDDPMTLAVWERHRRVAYARRTRKGASPPPDIPAGEPPTTPAVGQPVLVDAAARPQREAP